MLQTKEMKETMERETHAVARTHLSKRIATSSMWIEICVRGIQLKAVLWKASIDREVPEPTIPDATATRQV